MLFARRPLLSHLLDALYMTFAGICGAICIGLVSSGSWVFILTSWDPCLGEHVLLLLLLLCRRLSINVINLHFCIEMPF